MGEIVEKFPDLVHGVKYVATFSQLAAVYDMHQDFVTKQQSGDIRYGVQRPSPHTLSTENSRMLECGCLQPR